jgi:hypothetical protein
MAEHLGEFDLAGCLLVSLLSLLNSSSQDAIVPRRSSHRPRIVKDGIAARSAAANDAVSFITATL